MVPSYETFTTIHVYTPAAGGIFTVVAPTSHTAVHCHRCGPLLRRLETGIRHGHLCPDTIAVFV